METEILYAIANDGNIIGTRLGLSGISESILKSLLQHELDRRAKNKEEDFKNREIAIKEKDNRLRTWLFVHLGKCAYTCFYIKKWAGW